MSNPTPDRDQPEPEQPIMIACRVVGPGPGKSAEDLRFEQFALKVIADLHAVGHWERHLAESIASFLYRMDQYHKLEWVYTVRAMAASKGDFAALATDASRAYTRFEEFLAAKLHTRRAREVERGPGLEPRDQQQDDQDLEMMRALRAFPHPKMMEMVVLHEGYLGRELTRTVNDLVKRQTARQKEDAREAARAAKEAKAAEAALNPKKSAAKSKKVGQVPPTEVAAPVPVQSLPAAAPGAQPSRPPATPPTVQTPVAEPPPLPTPRAPIRIDRKLLDPMPLRFRRDFIPFGEKDLDPQDLTAEDYQIFEWDENPSEGDDEDHPTEW